MNPPHDGPTPRTLPERVAVLEAIVPMVQDNLNNFGRVLGDQGALLNTIHLQVNTLTQNLGTVNTERSRWKDPMLYISGISVLIAAWAVLYK